MDHAGPGRKPEKYDAPRTAAQGRSGRAFAADRGYAARAVTDRSAAAATTSPPIRPRLCVLFLHHKDDALTRIHYDRIRRSNPDAVIVPLCDQPTASLPDAIDVSRFDTPWNTDNKWKSCDTMIWRWFRNRAFDAERYVVLEYDVRCDVDLLAYYDKFAGTPNGPADVICARWVDPAREPGWSWFGRHTARLDPIDRVYRAGIVPVAGVCFTHDALVRADRVVTTADVFSELRLGTAVSRAGLRVATFHGAARRHFDWTPYRWPIVTPGLYHAVKVTNHNEVRFSRIARRLVAPFVK